MLQMHEEKLPLIFNWKKNTNPGSSLYKLWKLYGKVTVITPTDGVSTLSWWLGLSAPETLSAMPAVA
jgi:hypothetical protein